MSAEFNAKDVREHRRRLLEAASSGDWHRLRQVDLEIRMLLAELREKRFKSGEVKQAVRYLERAHDTAMMLAKEQRELLQRSLSKGHDLNNRAHAYGNVIRANFEAQ